jgi:predicted transcriptional regulator
MPKESPHHFSRREREIMDIIYQRGRATAADIMEELHNPPSYSAVRTLLRVLEEKGHLRHEQSGQRYVFKPVVNRERAKRSALQKMLKVFFDNSTEAVVAALLDMPGARLTDEERARLSKLIEQSGEGGA